MNSTLALRMALRVDKFMDESRLVVESRFNQFVAHYFGNDPVLADTVMSTLITIGLYWAVGLLYTLVDITGKPAFLLKYKIQNPENSRVSRENLIKLTKQVLFNQILAMTLAVGYFHFKHTFLPPPPELPTLTRMLVELVLFQLFREVFFYYGHRCCHHPRLYKHIHKQHHEWTSPIAIAAVYCHPIEHITVNVLPVLVGPFLLRSHSLTFWLWGVYVMLLTLNDHCGYHFPFCQSPVYHDYHHVKFNTNYGILGFFDWFHGTDAAYRKSKYYKRDRMYFTVTPPKDIFENKID